MIIATYLVKDDSDVLASSIEHNLNEGVDALIVTEHNPSPEASQILDSFKGQIISRTLETSDGYYQADWVTRMAQIASRYKGAWVLHCDADEMWCSLKSLAAVKAPVAYTQLWYNYLPYSVDEFHASQARYYEQPTGRSWFGRGMQAKRKVMHRSDLNVKIKQGNHGLSSDKPLLAVVSPVYIKHYPVRTYRQFEQKAVIGGKAYESSNLPEFMGRHWRRWYQSYKGGRLLAVYKSFLATPDNSDFREALLAGRVEGPLL